VPGQEHGQHPGKKLHRLRHRLGIVLVHRLGADVRKTATPSWGSRGFFFAGGADNSPAIGEAYKGVYAALNWTGVPLWAKFFFQLVFAGTAATIVSGAVAERIKFHSFIFFSFILVGIMYPITGHWIWGGGFLQALGMFDFAGSTVVHSVGGWSALAGVILLGTRTGKYRADGSVNPIFGHSMSLVTLGASSCGSDGSDSTPGPPWAWATGAPSRISP